MTHNRMAGRLGVLALAAACLTPLPSQADARGFRHGGGGLSHVRGFAPIRLPPAFVAAPRPTHLPVRLGYGAPAFRPAPAPPRLAHAPSARPAGPAWTAHPGAQVVHLRRSAPSYRYRAYGWGWGWGGVPAAIALPVAPPSLPVASDALTDQGFLAGGAPTGGCPPPPPELWIGGRLWIPDHQACDGSIVPGRWGATSPLATARN